jgi:hypothetical protein
LDSQQAHLVQEDEDGQVTHHLLAQLAEHLCGEVGVVLHAVGQEGVEV